jgi:hypothetical protein
MSPDRPDDDTANEAADEATNEATDEAATEAADEAAFGPGGYLPERAAKRARKIVLREEMGLQWPIAAVLAAVLVLAAGIWYVVGGTQPPAAPFEAILDIDEVDPRGAAVLTAGEPPRPLVIVRAGGGVRVFRAPTDAVIWCAESGRLEAPGGAVWNTNGRLVGGPGDSLEPVPSQVFDGTLYVNPDGAGVRLPPDRDDEISTTCV